MKTRLFVGLLIIVTFVSAWFSPLEVKASDCGHSWSWNFTLEFPPGFWKAGPHQYNFHITTEEGVEVFRHREFQATENAPLYRGQVFLRTPYLLSVDGQVTEINPAQDTAMQLTWYTNPDEFSRKEAEALRDATALQVSWDNGEWVDVPAGPLTKFCAFYKPSHFQRSWGHGY
jgi:hypothetical protein